MKTRFRWVATVTMMVIAASYGVVHLVTARAFAASDEADAVLPASDSALLAPDAAAILVTLQSVPDAVMLLVAGIVLMVGAAGLRRHAG